MTVFDKYAKIVILSTLAEPKTLVDISTTWFKNKGRLYQPPIMKEIQKAAYEQQLAVEHNEQIVVGVNDFRIEEDHKPDLLKIDVAIQDKQIARLRKLKARRDSEAVSSALKRLRSCAEGSDNLMPPIINAVKSYATVGEICGTLRSIFGEYRDKFTL